jgi:hypothetical protein
MSKFTETVKQDTPRLVVMFRRDGDNEMFQWGMVGEMPILTLVGYIIRVQAELFFRAAEECPEPALVIAWDVAARKFDWFVHQDIPVDSLVGMLETVKTVILSTHMARQAANQQMILGPDGLPARR